MRPDDFMIIAITSSDLYPNEAARITELLDSGRVHYVHIRKPGWTLPQTSDLISRIPARLYPKLKLHDHFTLMERYHLRGVHLNSRNPLPPQNCSSISKSCHSLEELSDIESYEYVTLSPVFDSISKTGYKAAFNHDELKKELSGKRVVALGGVTPDKFDYLKSLGFCGAALLGYFFPVGK